MEMFLYLRCQLIFESMEKISFRRVMAFAVASAFVIVAPSCVNNKYELSEENLDLNVTVFQEGVSLPLGSSESVQLKKILEMADLSKEMQDYILHGSDGYSLSYKAEKPLDLSEQLSEISGAIDIDEVTVNEPVKINLSGVNISTISYDGDEIDEGKNISEMFKGIGIKPIGFNKEFSVDANLRQYDLHDVSWDINFGTFEGTPSLAKLPDIPAAALDLLPDKNYTIKELNDALGIGIPDISLNTEFDGFEQMIEVPSQKFPDMIESVSEIHVSPDAKLILTIGIEDPFFTGGSIVPHLDMDLSHIFTLKGVEDGKIGADFELKEGQWSVTKEYTIETIVVEEDEWEKDDEGILHLIKDPVKVEASGSLTDNGLSTTPARLKQWLADPEHSSRELNISINATFDNFAVDDVTMKFKTTPFEYNVDDIEVTIPDINLPEEAKSIDNVVFTEDSKIVLDLGAHLPEGINFEMDDLKIKFPDALVVEGADNQNTITFDDINLAAGNFSPTIKVSGFKVGDIVDGKIPGYKAKVAVSAHAHLNGEIHTAKIPTTPEEDLTLEGSVVGNLEVGDYKVALKEYRVDKETMPSVFVDQEIKFEVPKELADIDGVSIFFEDSPAVSIEISLPQDVSLGIRPLDTGFSISFPRMLKFKIDETNDDWFVDTEEQYALVFPAGRDLPSSVVLPVESVEVKPVKDETDEKYYVKGNVKVDGALGIADGTVITMSDVTELSKEGTEVRFKAVLPKLEPKTLGISSYVSKIDETFDLDLLKDVDLPENLVRVGTIELDNVYLSLEVTTGENFPGIGSDADLTVGVKVGLPDFIEVDENRLDPDGKLSLSGRLEKVSPESDVMRFAIEPVHIKSLQLDKTREQLSDLPCIIDITGSVSLSGASLVLDDWLGKTHEINIDAALKTVEAQTASSEEGGKIKISSITGNIDYQIDPINETIDLSDLKETLSGDNLSATIDLSTFYAAAVVETNLGVPLKAKLNIVPYYAGEAGTAVERDIVFEPSESADQTKKTTFWISNERPSDETYTYVNLDLFKLLYKDETKQEMIEKADISITAGTDPEHEIIFEPQAAYNLTVDYSAGLPVKFGKDFQIMYKDTIQGIPQELGQIMKYGSLGLGGVIENSLPFTVTVSVNLLDSQENVIPMKDKAGQFKVRSCDASGNPRKTEFDLIAAIDQDVDASDVAAIEIVFKIDSKDAAGVPLSEDSFIRVESLFARIPEGVTVDLGGMLFPEDTDGESTDNGTNE